MDEERGGGGGARIEERGGGGGARSGWEDGRNEENISSSEVQNGTK